MKNRLLDRVEYQEVRTGFGVWRRHLSQDGNLFEEFRSYHEILGWPLFHYTRGISPETGKRVTAKGFIAVGRFALGGIAIGHASLGVVAVGQAGVGLLFGLGQLATGLYALGQVALAVNLGIGQVATGEVAIGQVAAGRYVLAQVGYGEYRWTPGHADAEAQAYFQELWRSIRTELNR